MGPLPPTRRHVLATPDSSTTGAITATGTATQSGGTLQVQATQFTQSSAGSVDLSAPSQGGALSIQATGSVKLQGGVNVSATQDSTPAGTATQGGQIEVNAQGDIEVTDATIDASGGQGGRIQLRAAAEPQPNNPQPQPDVPGQGRLAIMGNSTLSTRGRKGQGGSATLLSDHIDLLDNTAIDASGTAGGGTVLVGGDWQGSNGVYQATTVMMAQGATIDASATQQGDGGKVVLWSDVTKDGLTRVAGRIAARGAGTAAVGGKVETSGHRLAVDSTVQIDVGAGGQWLIDPADVTISTGTDLGHDASFVPNAAAATTVVNVTTLLTALNAGTDVTVTTTNSGTSGAGNGDITVSNAVATTGTGAGALTLTAARNINIDANITLTGTGKALLAKAAGNILLSNNLTFTTNGGNVLFASDTDRVLFSSEIDTGAGSIFARGAITINSTGGDITLGGGDSSGSGYALGGGGGADPYMGIRLSGAISFNSAGGNISIKGKSSTTASNGAAAWGVGADNTIDINSGTGTIYIEGVSQNSTGGAFGAGVTLSGIFGINGLAMSISSANPTANAIKIIGDGSGGNGLEFHSNVSSIVATAGGGITLQGKRGVGSSDDIYFPGGNILANSGAIQLLGMSAGGQLFLENFNASPTTIGAKNGTAVTSSSSNILLQHDLVYWHDRVDINTTGTFTAQPFSAGFSQDILRSYFAFNANFTNTSNKLSGLTLGKDGSAGMGGYPTTVDEAISVNGPISIYGGNINLNANLTSTLSGAAILAKASGNIVQAARVVVTTNGGSVTYWADSDANSQGNIVLTSGISGNTTSVSRVEEMMPPMTTVARGRCTSLPVPTLIAMGTNPSPATRAVVSTGRSRVMAPSITASSSALPPVRNDRIKLTITRPFSTATPESAMNPTPADMDKGMSRSHRAATPPVKASGTPLNTSTASFADPKAVTSKRKMRTKAVGTTICKRRDADIRCSNVPP